MRTIHFALLLLLTVIGLDKVAAQSERRVEGAMVQGYARAMISAPPAELTLDTFYKKYADAFGIPVVSSDKTPNSAVLFARDIINYMLLKRPDIRAVLVQRKARVLVMAESEMETDLPERRDWKKPTPTDPRLTPGERENYDKPGGIASMTGSAGK